MLIVRIYVAIIKLALLLAMLGVLKSCTLDLLGLAGKKTELGMISYSKFTHALTNQ